MGHWSNVFLGIIATFFFAIHHANPTVSDTTPPATRRRRSLLGFTLPLIRRNSLISPLIHRHDRRRFGIESATSPVFPDAGEYLLKLSVGTPPVDVYAIADTGSDLFWIQCLPCDQCYNQTRPKFDPSASATYANVQCGSDKCHLLDNAFCSTPPNLYCNYTYGYASTALTQGFLATETLTLTDSSTGKSLSLPNIVFGCGHNNTGGFNTNEMGIVGLGRGPLSFISQMAPHLGGKRFSQCLVPFHTDPKISSTMRFGDGSEVTVGPGVVSTNLVIDNVQDPTYYFVTLNGITVGHVFVPFSDTISKGNMFLDSGTPPTIVPKDFYNRLELEVKRAVPDLTPITDPTLGSQLCYGEEIQVKGPILTAHFDGGNVDVPLKQKSIFIEAKPGVFCFAMASTDSVGGIFGNFAQTDYLIGFDIDQKTVSFKPADCTKER